MPRDDTQTTDDCGVVEITLHANVYAEFLIRLDRFVDRQDNQADRNWLRQFVKDMRMREMQELH
jgi:hypothetical protein